jgi:hypothetical protein
VAAVAAFASGIIFEKFNRFFAFGAFGLKDGAWYPVLCILTRTFHFRSSWDFLPDLAAVFSASIPATYPAALAYALTYIKKKILIASHVFF